MREKIWSTENGDSNVRIKGVSKEDKRTLGIETMIKEVVPELKAFAH